MAAIVGVAETVLFMIWQARVSDTGRKGGEGSKLHWKAVGQKKLDGVDGQPTVPVQLINRVEDDENTQLRRRPGRNINVTSSA